MLVQERCEGGCSRRIAKTEMDEALASISGCNPMEGVGVLIASLAGLD